MGHPLLKFPYFGRSAPQLTVHDRRSLEGRDDQEPNPYVAEALVAIGMGALLQTLENKILKTRSRFCAKISINSKRSKTGRSSSLVPIICGRIAMHLKRRRLAWKEANLNLNSAATRIFTDGRQPNFTRTSECLTHSSSAFALSYPRQQLGKGS